MSTPGSPDARAWADEGRQAASRMKPNFALTLSFEGIGLLHRGETGWIRVGDVPLDSEDLHGELSELREHAATIAIDKLHTKIVIPNDQIRYLSFDAEGLSVDEIGDEARRKLDGVTPYAIADLAFDWSISAGQVFVAAVARETLAEAESFAVQHGFDPLCFVGIPEARDFLGEPWFGQTQHAETIVPEDAVFERDTAAIRITGDIVDKVQEQKLNDLNVKKPTEVEEDSPRLAEPEPEPDHVDNQEETGQESSDVSAGLDLTSDRSDTPASTTEATLAFTTRRVIQNEAENARAQTEDKALSATASVTADTVLPDIDPLEPEPVPAPVAPEVSVAQLSEEKTAFEAKRDTSPPVSTGFSSPSQPSVKLSAERPARAKDEKEQMTLFGDRNTASSTSQSGRIAALVAGLLVVAVIGGAAWISFFQDTDEQQAQDVPSLSTDEDTDLAGLPESVGEPEIGASPAPAEDFLEQPDVDVDLSGISGLENETLAALPEVDPAPPTADPGSTLNPEPPTAEDAEELYQATGIWLLAPAIPTVPASQSINDFYQASIDPSIGAQDAVALPSHEAYAPDPQPAPLANPAPPGTQFDFDYRGFVRATPDGAITPNGVSVIAGRPALLPPERPAETLENEAALDPNGTILDLTEAQRTRVSEVRPKSRPVDLSEQNERAALGSGGRTQSELSAFRPKPRPLSAQELAEQAASSSTANLGETESETDQLFTNATEQAVSTSSIPRARPEGFDQVVARAVQEEEQREREAEERRAAQQAPQQSGGTQSASLAQPLLEPEETGRVAAAVPRNQRVTPSAPTATSVARAATEKNVLRLRRVNLIGVYGGPSDRRALVRLANGRYKKVQVGDRLDGGRVTAIGASELRYSKGGRDLALKMPQG